MESQICKKCGKSKPLTTDHFARGINKRNGIEISYWYKTCRLCDRERVLEKSYRYKRKNRKLIADKQKEYYQDHKEESAAYHSAFYQNNKEDIKARVKKNIYARRKTDILFVLKERVSQAARGVVKKGRKSIAKYLPYSFQQLKDHLQQQFEFWMTWDNYGVYRLDTWKDNDPTTWTWQIDHIIPHSKFNYTSIEDQAFLDCWALTNLRPYSAKQNVIDGDRE